MKKMMVQLTLVLCWLALMSMTDAYPVESKPLNNNPESWNFGDGWNIYNPQDESDPSASALISSDSYKKKSKITPKSIFIAPNAYNDHPCPHGFRIDVNGKCIKTVTIDQDVILAARISELFGFDGNQNKNSDTDSDYDYFDDETKSEKDSGPLQITLPLAIDIAETTDGKKVELVIEEKVFMRNLDPKNLTTSTSTSTTTTTTEKPEVTTKPTTTTKITKITTTSVPVTEITESVQTDEPTTSATTQTVVDETTTVTQAILLENSTVKTDDDEATTSTLELTTVEPMTTTTTTVPTTVTTTTTIAPKVKIFSVDFMPKSPRKSNRLGQASARFKNSRDQDKLNRPRKQKTTAISTKSSEKLTTKFYKIDRNQVPKKNRTRTGSKRPGYRNITTTTTEVVTTEEIPVTQKPFWWLPKGWSIDETKDKPVLVRFWSNQPLQQDQAARSQSSRQQRVNSRMPSENIFREITAPELDSV